MIPKFNESGVLPPFVGEAPLQMARMSPYEVTVGDIARRFVLSSERIEIFQGFLEYRTELRKLGVGDDGFQWVDGSFIEDVEKLRERPPNDIDVITFARLPVGGAKAKGDLIREHPHLFDFRATKSRYHCDAYFVDLDKSPSLLINDARYWFGLFSHQRESFIWKGILSVRLYSDDEQARLLLQEDGHA
jgi:hypothetical protein